MKAFSVICLVLLLAVTVRSEEIKEEDGVLVLTQDNFQQAIDENEFILVEFYAPWCGHCKALAPNYAKAAQQLKDKDSPIKLAKVDATEQKELGTRFEIRGYPTLKFFKNGVPKDYSGGRQTNDIVNWVETNAGPSFTVHNTVEEVRAFIDSADVTVMGYFESNETPEATAFIAAADGGLDSIKFGLCTSKEVAETMQVKQPSVIVYKKFDDGEAVFPGTNWTAPDILSFINSERIGLVTVFSDETAPILFGGDVKSHLLAFISSDDAKFEDYMTNLKNTAKKFRGKVLFVLIDAKKEDSSRIMEFFTLTESQLPAVRLIYLSDDMKRYHPETEEIVEDKLTEFVQNYLDGKLQVML
jgi:protein disulfide-isomerase A1